MAAPDGSTDAVMQERGEDEDFLARRELLLLGERIIFVLDEDSEEALLEWEPGQSRIEAAATAIRLIIRRKLNSTQKNTFGLATYDSASRVTWREGFTSDFQRLDEALTTLTSLAAAPPRGGEEVGRGAGVRLAEVFSQLIGNCSETGDASPGAEPPRVLTRFIFFYLRSSEVPVYTSSRPIFVPTNKTHFLDCLFLHHKLTVNRECAVACQNTLNILSFIQRGDPDAQPEEHEHEENNYLFETHASNMRLMTFAALLCAHPAHREEQTDMLAKFNVNDASLQDIRDVDQQSRLEEAANKTNMKTKQGKCAQQTAGTVTATNIRVITKKKSNNNICVDSTAASSTTTGTTSPPLPPPTSTAKNLSDAAAHTVKNMFGMNFGSKSKKNNEKNIAANDNNNSY